MRRTRVAIIGLGMAAAPHARSLAELSDRAEVVAAFSPTEARREDFCRRWGVPAAGSLEAVFDDPRVDAVLVLTPPSTHGELVARAAAAGKHVMVAGLDAENAPSIALHEKLGFTRAGRLDQVGCKFGRWLDLLLLIRRLDDAPAPPS